MNRPWSRIGIALGTLWLFTLAGGVGPLRAADEDALKKEILKLNDIVGSDPIESEIEKLTKSGDHAKKLLAAAVALAKEKEPPFNYNSAYILAHVANEIKDVEAGKIFFHICIDKAKQLKSNQKIVRSYDALARFLIRNGKYEDAEKLCTEFMEIRDDEIRAYRVLLMAPLIQAYVSQGKNEDAAKHLKEYERRIQRVGSDELQDELKNVAANLYLEIGDLDRAVELLRGLLKKKPDDAGINNDLGYVLADHDRDIDEAAGMIKKALDKQPKNAAYLDSMGWVLFKQKKYKEAKDYLLQAVKDPKDGQHTEIYDHLGEVHKALNEKAEAAAAWKKALEVVTPSHRDRKRKIEVEKKLKEISE